MSSSSDSPLLAILLVTSSASGSNLVWSWPPRPKPSIRLSRPRPIEWETEPEVSWRAAHDFDQSTSTLSPETRDKLTASLSDYATKSSNFDYEWRRPTTEDPHVYKSKQSAASRPDSGRSSPSQSQDGRGVEAPALRDDNAYGEILGYDPTFLAEVLSPKPALCHQKFELSVDELAFIGHPVHIGKDGSWGWDELYAAGPPTAPVVDDKDRRGRTLDRDDEGVDPAIDISLSPELPRNDRLIQPPLPQHRKKRSSNAINSFHLVLVLDRPDPSFVASSGLHRIINMYYRQVAFKLTAAMHYEQGRVDFVGQQAALLSSLKESCITKGTTFQSFIDQALAKSSLAAAIKTVYTSVSCNSLANIIVHEIPVHVQLPPQHAAYLRGDLESEEEAQIIHDLQLDEAEYLEHDAQGRWADEVQYGYRLPPLLPWKALLVLDGESDHVESLWVSNRKLEAQEDQAAKETLKRFIRLASPNLSLSDIAALQDLDLDSEVYPMARLLVYNRKAKIIDVVPLSLKNIYAPPAFLTGSLADYAAQFAKAFPPSVPSLFALLASLSSSHQAFSNIVPSPSDDRPLYTDVLTWLLQRDLLVMLHVRIRIVATTAIKERVRRARRREQKEKRRRLLNGEGDDDDDEELSDERSSDDEDYRSASNSPEVGNSSPDTGRSRRRRSRSASDARTHVEHSGSQDSGADLDADDLVEEEELDYEGEGEEDDTEPSLIPNPARATRLQRRWLEAMMDGKSDTACHDFSRLYVYFDGKKTTDEIIFRTEMSRRHLREVLHEFEEYLITSLHS